MGRPHKLLRNSMTQRKGRMFPPLKAMPHSPARVRPLLAAKRMLNLAKRKTADDKLLLAYQKYSYLNSVMVQKSGGFLHHGVNILTFCSLRMRCNLSLPHLQCRQRRAPDEIMFGICCCPWLISPALPPNAAHPSQAALLTRAC